MLALACQIHYWGRHGQSNVPISYAGIVTMIISGGTIVSSLMSDKLTKRLGTGLLTAISVLITAVALFGFSLANSFILLCLWAIPYGLGAGAVDAALNNYVALYFSSRHMNWLHCFWGVGAALSPYIMGYCHTNGLGWNKGYSSVGFIQIILTAVLFITLPIWKWKNGSSHKADTPAAPVGLLQAIRIKGVKLMLVTFFGYCALESTAGLWASSYLVEIRGISVDTAALFASMFYIGITVGRFLCGFISDKLGDRALIRYGIFIIIFGIALVGIPFGSPVFALVGLVIIGLGCAPVYPAIIHSTPDNFGQENSQVVIGIQMASAYVGSTFMPPLFGFIADAFSLGLYPVYLLF